MKTIELDATIENLQTVTDFVNAELERIGCPMKPMMQIDVVIDELFSNIAHYAYRPEVGPATVSVDVKEDPVSVSISFTDRGRPFNPLNIADPNTTLSAEERQIGGLGIFIVKKTMDDVVYEYKDGRNILTIKKNVM